jgi:hypothetical protein
MAISGLIYLVLLFIICFCFVHIIKLAYIGFKSLKKPVQEEVKKQEKTPKPVYYIVEKKRAKRSYSEPKEIEFK